jgi:hypothetical protein
LVDTASGCRSGCNFAARFPTRTRRQGPRSRLNQFCQRYTLLQDVKEPEEDRRQKYDQVQHYRGRRSLIPLNAEKD